MTDQMTIPGAVDAPLVVNLTTLTVQGRRITRALYNQLREEPLIGDDGALNGRAWGYVNEHAKAGCGFFRGYNTMGAYDSRVHDRDHRHVIWQRGDELLRAEVLSLGAEERRVSRFGSELELRTVWSQLPPETIASRRRSLNLVAGLPQIFIGR